MGCMNVEQSARLERTEMRMVRWMCGVSLRDTRDMRERGLKREDAQEHEKWRKLLWEAAGQPIKRRP